MVTETWIRTALVSDPVQNLWVTSEMWYRHYLQQTPGLGISPAQPGAPWGLSFPGQVTRLVLSALYSSTRSNTARLSWTHTHTEDTSADGHTGCCLLTPTCNTTRIHIKPKYRQPSLLPPPWLSRLKLTRLNTCLYSVDSQTYPHSEIPQTPVWALCLFNSLDPGLSYPLPT